MDATAPTLADVTPKEQTFTPAQFGAYLKRFRIAAGLTQDALAERLPGSSRSTVAQWETGRNLPSPDTVRLIDTELHARGQLLEFVAATRAARSSQRRQLPSPMPDGARAPRRSLLQIFTEVGEALGKKYISTGSGAGWMQELHKSVDEMRTVGDAVPLEGPRPSPVSTAYGVRILLAISSMGGSAKVRDAQGRPVSLARIQNYLANSHYDRDGLYGWSTASLQKSNFPPSVEATAIVLTTLHKLNPSRAEQAPSDIEWLRALLAADGLLAPDGTKRVSILSLALEAMLQIDPDHDLTQTLVRNIIKCRFDKTGWPERSDASLVDPPPSVVHTARAIHALQRAHDLMSSDVREEALEVATEAVGWLVGQREMQCAIELADGPKQPPLRQFTAPWVVKALVVTGRFDMLNTASRLAMDEIFNAYRDDQHFWLWANGEMPIWMTCDAVEALRLVALAQMPWLSMGAEGA